MRIIDRLRARHQTEFVKINPHNCAACWDCVNSCSKKVLGKIDFLFHRHVKFVNASACIGCMKCVRVCSHGCITMIK